MPVTITKTAIFTIALGYSTLAGAAPAQESDDTRMRLYWIFLATGRSVDGVAEHDIARMQKEHLANFGRLAGEGKLLTAGPMRDPEGVLRGIVIIKAPDREAVNRMFEDDPYVTKGYMKVETHEARIDHGQFVAIVTPEALEEFRIVILSEPKDVDRPKKERREVQTDYVANLAGAGTILLSSTFVGQSGRRSVWITKAQDNLKRLADAAPGVADGVLEYRIFPLYLGKGSLGHGE